MQTLYDAISHHAYTQPKAIAIASEDMHLSYADLVSTLNQLASILPLEFLANTVAIDIENHAAWAVLDLALMPHPTVNLPIPPFFSESQIQHALSDAGAEAVITDNPVRYEKLLGSQIHQSVQITLMGKTLTLLRLDGTPKPLPNKTAKITYTSGTTGQPKGVCLSASNMTTVAKSIAIATELTTQNRHLAILPLAVLLENVAGLYANLFAGGTSYLLPSRAVGFNGAQFDIVQLISTLRDTKANTAILMPEMLTQLVEAYESGIKPLSDLNFVAVGGASVAPALLQRARQVELPVFEGYGLSESNSVVALNTLTANRIGSVGKPLPHLSIKFNPDNEVLVSGTNHLGYVGHPSPNDTWLATGDIGYLDEEGYLFINGRKKNLFITAYGRNVSPEWLERDLSNNEAILQACVFGEAKPWNVAVIVANSVDPADIALAVASVNHHLPDYAQISQWLIADSPFTVSNQQLTPNGRLKRAQIWQQYQASIESLYAVTLLRKQG